jgi:hypothetical protein
VRLGALLCAALAGSAAAQPMNLADGRPRWVTVRFEVSPAEAPGRTDSVYSPPVAAWLEPADEPGQLRVRIRGRDVEAQLLARERPIPGSFSDFVWIFDAASGEVRSATLSGTVLRTVGLGPAHWTVAAHIRARMDTRQAVGFTAPAGMLGLDVWRACTDPSQGDCTLVEPRPYDPASGYVNAVGEIAADSALVETHAFSPLGEAIFSEAAAPQVADDGLPAVSSSAASAAMR